MAFRAENLQQVRVRIDEAARRAGRDSREIRILAVSKTMPVEEVRRAYAAGQHLFGENRMQEGSGKAAETADLGDIRWHFIGHLQKNKARDAVQYFHMVQSVDSVELAARLDRLAGSLGRTLPVLVQLKQGGEESKHGFDETGARDAVGAIRSMSHLSLRGLMTIPPYCPDAEQARPFFRTLRKLLELLQREEAAGLDRFRELSMGMSHDLDVAVEEGATLVRVGTAIFGARGV